MRRRTSPELDGYDMQTEHDGTLEAAPDTTAIEKDLVGRFLGEHFFDPIATQALDDVLPYVRPLLQRALDRTQDWHIGDLVDYLKQGKAVLLLEWYAGRPQCAIVAQRILLTEGFAMDIMAIAAFDKRDQRYPNPDSFKLLTEVAKGWNCRFIQGMAQEPIARLWQRIQFKEVARLMRKEI